MIANYFELLKYAATGIASPDMTYYDKMRASMLMGGVVQTLTGQPPLSFKSDGTPITVWSMKGNGSQSGTPTPDAPIMPTFCGVLNENLAIIDTDSYSLNNWYYEDTRLTGLLPPGTYTISFVTDSVTTGATTDGTIGIGTTSDYTEDLEWFTRAAVGSMTTITVTLSESKCIWARFVRDHNIVKITCSISVSKICVEEGSTAYGYKIPITCAGQTVPVYLGQVSTVRKIRKLVFDGTENWQWSTGDQAGYVYLAISNATGYAVQNNEMCSHFVSKRITGSNNEQGIGVQNKSAPSSMTAILVRYTGLTTDATTFKSYLAQQYANGTPVTIWYVLATPETGIVNEPLCKISDYADELHSEDAGAAIPTVKGNNTLTVETDLQPSEVSITGHIKAN